jgi:hypothetical protein
MTCLVEICRETGLSCKAEPFRLMRLKVPRKSVTIAGPDFSRSFVQAWLHITQQGKMIHANCFEVSLELGTNLKDFFRREFVSVSADSRKTDSTPAHYISQTPQSMIWIAHV